MVMFYFICIPTQSIYLKCVSRENLNDIEAKWTYLKVNDSAKDGLLKVKFK